MLGIRNIIPFVFDPKLVDGSSLQDALAEHPLGDPGPQEMERIGFVPAVASEPGLFVRSVGNYCAFAVGIKKKILPGSVVNERLQVLVEKITREEGRKVGGKERKRLKDQVLNEMLSQAFVKSSRINAWMDLANGYLFVDASSRNNAELVVTQIREALGSFPAVPAIAGTDRPAATLFYDWLREESATELMALGDECVLKSDETTWTGKHVDLCGAEVEEHLDAGSMPKRLGLTFNERVTFLLDDELVVRKFKLTDVALEAMEQDSEDAISHFDAGFALVAGEVDRLFAHLKDVFQIPAVAS